MAGPEQRLWTNRVKPPLNATPGLVYDRIETGRVTVGVPDVLYTYQGRTGFIELKVGNDLRRWSFRQRKWAERHTAAGARVLIVLATDYGDFVLDAAEHILLYPPRDKRPLEKLIEML